MCLDQYRRAFCINERTVVGRLKRIRWWEETSRNMGWCDLLKKKTLSAHVNIIEWKEPTQSYIEWIERTLAKRMSEHLADVGWVGRWYRMDKSTAIRRRIVCWVTWEQWIPLLHLVWRRKTVPALIYYFITVSIWKLVEDNVSYASQYLLNTLEQCREGWWC